MDFVLRAFSALLSCPDLRAERLLLLPNQFVRPRQNPSARMFLVVTIVILHQHLTVSLSLSKDPFFQVRRILRMKFATTLVQAA